MSETLETTAHPHPREGTDRPNRAPAALDPSGIPIDDRNTARLLIHAWRLAEHVKYMDAEFKEDGHWQQFLDADPLTVLARMTDAVSYDWNRQYKQQKDKKEAGAMSALLLELLMAVNDHARDMPEELPPSGELRRLISTRLSQPMIDLLGIYKKELEPAVTSPLLDRIKTWLQPYWLNNNATLNPDDIGPDAGFDYGLEPSRNRLEDLRKEVLQSAAWLVEQAESLFPTLLDRQQLHQPHMGLLLAFLQLFDKARCKLNGLTARHLDHYFSEILRISRRKPQPDRAWLLFEPAKPVTAHKLAEGLRFKGGKDDTGVERHYALERETVIRQANVKRLRSIYHDPATDRIHAANKADSADGDGEEFEGNPKWPLMGNSALNQTAPGFAISAPLLEITGGSKTIVATLSFTEKSFRAMEDRLDKFTDKTGKSYARYEKKLDHTRFDSAFVMDATGAKDWMTPLKSSMVIDHSRNSLVFTLDFEPDQAIANYSAKLHGRDFRADGPLIRMVLNTDVKPGHYHLFHGLQTQKINIEAHVEGSSDFLAQNDQGPVNPARPFMPFGARPTRFSAFYVGSREIFSKRLNHLTLSFTWKKEITNAKTIKAQGYWLEQTQWEQVGNPVFPFYANAGVTRLQFGEPPALKPISGGISTESLPGNKTKKGPARGKGIQGFRKPTAKSSSKQAGNDKTKVPEPYALDRFGAQPDLRDFKDRTKNLPRGFFELSLTEPADPLGHESYAVKYAEAVIEKIANKGVGKLPPAPDVPEAVSLRLDYSTSAQAVPGQTPAADSPILFHVGPFGAWQVDTASEKNPLPDYNDEGRLYIGLEEALPKQSVTLWFRLIEGGGNPFVDRPQISWSYLSGSVWKPLPDLNKVEDSTLGLTATGLITFSIPEDATTSHQRMETDLIWLRVNASNRTSALSPAMQIKAQAGSAVFVDRGNDPKHLESPLPAGSIKKLVIKDRAVKKIEQPMATRDGKPRETLSAWRLRTSERLRHKDRAVDPWDYEHLILQEFPQIHKVKCITHTDKDNARAPGHVTLALVPVLDPADAYDPYRPAVSQATIALVEDFLKTRHSQQVTLHVVNPKYEPIRVKTDVVLHPGFDASFYEKQLTADVMRFLAPWSFDPKANLLFGNRMHRSVILNYIEERPYVDYLRSFGVDRMDEHDNLLEADVQELRAQTARSILVTSRKHVIKVKQKAAP